MLGGYVKFVAGSAAGTLMFETMFFALFFFWRCGGMMLLGMSLYKSGFLGGRLSSSTYARVAFVATPFGLGLAFIGALELDRVAYAMPMRALVDLGLAGAVLRRSVTPRRSFGSSSAGDGRLRRPGCRWADGALNYLFHSITTSVMLLGWGSDWQAADYTASSPLSSLLDGALMISPIWLRRSGTDRGVVMGRLTLAGATDLFRRHGRSRRRSR